MLRRSLAAAVVLLIALPVLAQRTAPNITLPDVSELQIRIVYPDDRAAPKLVRVQLLTGTGMYAAEDFTDDLGTAQFRVGPGNYRVRVSGADIEETTSDSFTVYPRQGHHLEVITVTRKEGTGPAATSTEGSVSLVDLNVPRKAEKELEKGKSAMEKKALEKAEEHFRKAIAEYPGYATAHNYLGVIMMNSGRPAEGRAMFARAVELNDNYSAAHINMAKVLFGERNAKQAEAHLLKAIRTDPLNAEALTLLSNAQLINGNYVEAAANAKKVHSVPHEQYAMVHYIAGKALEAADQRGEAVVEYTMYLKEAPQGALADESRARIEAYKHGSN